MSGADGSVGHGVTEKNSCCTCTAGWTKHDGEGSASHVRWWAVVPLVVINVITLLLGICFLGVSAYAMATFESWQQYVSWSSLVACVVTSLFVLSLGLLGCCGAIKRNMSCLTMYLFFLFILCFVVLAMAAAVLLYGDTICGGHEMESKTCNVNLQSREVSNALIKIQTECCQSNMTVPICNNETTSLYQCMYPECDGNNEAYCVKYFTPCTLGMAKLYNGMKCQRTFPKPLTQTPDAMCIGIKSLIFKDIPADLSSKTTAEKKAALLAAAIWTNQHETICQKDFNPALGVAKYEENKIKKCTSAVGAAKNTCLAEERIAFTKVVASYFEDNMKNLGLGLVVLAAFLILIMILAFCSCCKNKSKLDASNNNNLQHDANKL